MTNEQITKHLIRGVIFDLGWTLMYYNGDWKQVTTQAYQKLEHFLRTNGVNVGKDFPTVFHQAREISWLLADETGREQTFEDVLSETLHRSGVKSSNGLAPRGTELFFSETEQYWLAYPDALDTLKDLSRRGLRLGLFSNADDDGLVQRAVVRLGFAPYLNPALSSAMKHRLRKPDPRAFKLISEAWQLPPTEIVVVGDAPAYDILGAHRAGMSAIWIDHGENNWWQKIPDQLANEPAVRPDLVIHTLSELPNAIEKK